MEVHCFFFCTLSLQKDEYKAMQNSAPVIIHNTNRTFLASVQKKKEYDYNKDTKTVSIHRFHKRNKSDVGLDIFIK